MTSAALLNFWTRHENRSLGQDLADAPVVLDDLSFPKPTPARLLRELGHSRVFSSSRTRTEKIPGLTRSPVARYKFRQDGLTRPFLLFTPSSRSPRTHSG